MDGGRFPPLFLVVLSAFLCKRIFLLFMVFSRKMSYLLLFVQLLIATSGAANEVLRASYPCGEVVWQALSSGLVGFSPGRRLTFTCVALPPQKTEIGGQTTPKYRSGTTFTTVKIVYDFPQFCHNSSATVNHISHPPAMGSWVLSLQCGKAAAVLVTCKHRDSVAEV